MATPITSTANMATPITSTANMATPITSAITSTANMATPITSAITSTANVVMTEYNLADVFPYINPFNIGGYVDSGYINTLPYGKENYSLTETITFAPKETTTLSITDKKLSEVAEVLGMKVNTSHTYDLIDMLYEMAKTLKKEEKSKKVPMYALQKTNIRRGELYFAGFKNNVAYWDVDVRFAVEFENAHDATEYIKDQLLKGDDTFRDAVTFSDDF